MVETLRDKIKKSKADQEQAARASNPYFNPVSPVDMNTMNTDVQKMAGTPAQKEAALQQAVQTDPAASVQTYSKQETPERTAVENAQEYAGAQSQDLQQAMEGPRDYQADAATERAKQFSESMKGFGSLGSRVEQLIMTELQGSQAPVTDVNFQIDDNLVSQLAVSGQESNVRSALQQFQQAATPEEAFEALAASSSSFANPSAAIMEIVQATYKTDPEAQKAMVAEAIATNVIDPDEINFQQLVDQGILNIEGTTVSELGLDTGDLEALLGANWTQMTPGDVEKKLSEIEQDELNKRDQIMEQLSDPTLDANARVSLVDELKRLGAVGELEAEQVAAESVAMAADAGKIVYNGKVTDVADLLSDENIQTEVKNYLMGGEGAEQWAERNADFAAWIDRESEALKASGAQLEGRLGSFSDIQQKNEEFRTDNIADEAEGAALNKDVMDALGYGDGFQSSEFDPSSSNLYSALEDLGSDSITKGVVTALNQLPKDALEELKGEFLSSEEGAQELVRLLSNPEASKDLVALADMSNKLDALQGDHKALTETFTGRTPEMIQRSLNSLRLNAALGDSNAAKQLNLMNQLFDRNGDGKIDTDPQALSASIKELVGSGSLESVMKNLSGLREVKHAGEDTTYGGPNMEAHNRLQSYASDGKITDTELRGLSNGFAENYDAGLDTFASIRNNPQLMASMGINPQALADQITDLASKKVSKLTDGFINQHNSMLTDPDFAAREMSNSKTRNDMFSALDKLQAEVNSSGTPEERAVMQQKINELDKATSRIYLNDWGREVGYGREFAGLRFNDINQVKSIFKHAPPELIDKVFYKTPDGKVAAYPIKSLQKGYSPEVQEFLQYAMGTEEKLKRQGKSWNNII